MTIKIKKYQRPTVNQQINMSFDQETVMLKHAFKHYNNRAKKYISGKPSHELAESRLNKAFDNLLKALNNPVVIHRFETLIHTSNEVNYRTVKELMQGISCEDFEKELNIAEIFGINKSNVKEVIQSHKNDNYDLDKVESIAELMDHMEKIHDELIAVTKKARKINPRVEKRKRKRDIRLGIATSVFGASCGITNTYTMLTLDMPLSVVSYSAMIASFNAALRDFIGEKPKD